MTREIYTLRISNTDTDKVRYMKIPAETITREDVTEFGTLTQEGKAKLGLLKTDKATMCRKGQLQHEEDLITRDKDYLLS